MSISTLPMATTTHSGRCPGFITYLIMRCARGDEAALGRLFDLFLPMVLGIVGNGTASPATDALVVNAFSRVWLLAPTYDPETRDAVGWVLNQARDVRVINLTPS